VRTSFLYWKSRNLYQLTMTSGRFRWLQFWVRSWRVMSLTGYILVFRKLSILDSSVSTTHALVHWLHRLSKNNRPLMHDRLF
jgi:hypothetical protein